MAEMCEAGEIGMMASTEALDRNVPKEEFSKNDTKIVQVLEVITLIPVILVILTIFLIPTILYALPDSRRVSLLPVKIATGSLIQLPLWPVGKAS